MNYHDMTVKQLILLQKGQQTPKTQIYTPISKSFIANKQFLCY